MSKYYLLLALLILGDNCFGQIQPKIIFDTSINPLKVRNKKFYSKTSFSNIDTLSFWNYKLDTTYRGRGNDSIKPIGMLMFWRTKSIDDSISKIIYKQLWTPYMAFDIFNVTDTNWIFR